MKAYTYIIVIQVTVQPTVSFDAKPPHGEKAFLSNAPRSDMPNDHLKKEAPIANKSLQVCIPQSSASAIICVGKHRSTDR